MSDGVWSFSLADGGFLRVHRDPVLEDELETPLIQALNDAGQWPKDVRRYRDTWRRYGTYRAEIYNKGNDGRYHAKGFSSTMFPDEWSKNEVFAAGQAAMRDAIRRGDFDVKTGRWDGVAFGVWNSKVHRYHISGYADFRDGKVKRVKTFFPTKVRSAQQSGREL